MVNISSSLEHTLKLYFSKMVTYNSNVTDHKFQKNISSNFLLLGNF